MLQNKLLRVVQAHLLGFSTGIMFSGNAFACSACFIHLFSSSVAWSNWSLPNFPAESFIHPYSSPPLDVTPHIP
jgi:hypothetical protein